MCFPLIRLPNYNPLKPFDLIKINIQNGALKFEEKVIAIASPRVTKAVSNAENKKIYHNAERKSDD